ncbi:MAG: FlgD immunoglobulin-like domain containing protein, partial [Candidatus Cloacimonetes bacterium]|nr:FlgD immunoglobulin-like domain containing protein [Candidatus Cloacimonadota bacterium]
IAYSVKETAPVKLEIYNIKGQKVRTLVNDVMTAGNHSVVWNGHDDNGKNVGSGVYFYRMTTPKFSSTQKMLLMK